MTNRPTHHDAGKQLIRVGKDLSNMSSHELVTNPDTKLKVAYIRNLADQVEGFRLNPNHIPARSEALGDGYHIHRRKAFDAKVTYEAVTNIPEMIHWLDYVLREMEYEVAERAVFRNAWIEQGGATNWAKIKNFADFDRRQTMGVALTTILRIDLWAAHTAQTVYKDPQ